MLPELQQCVLRLRLLAVQIERLGLYLLLLPWWLRVDGRRGLLAMQLDVIRLWRPTIEEVGRLVLHHGLNNDRSQGWYLHVLLLLLLLLHLPLLLLYTVLLLLKPLELLLLRVAECIKLSRTEHPQIISQRRMNTCRRPDRRERRLHKMG